MEEDTNGEQLIPANEVDKTNITVSSLSEFSGSSNEKDRLNAVRSYHILDTPEEKDYDDLTALASSICQTPIALISMVDENRQWFKSHYGIDEQETTVEHSFCTYAIASPNNILIVPDAKQDLRFYDNPLVTGELDITFYAGVPLVNSEGFALGSLCVIDHHTKELTNDQIKALMIIAKQVVDKLELRRKITELQEARKKLETSFNHLKLSEDERKDFVTNISHDLRTPLSIAKGYTETLLLQGNMNPKSVEYLQLIENKIQLVENLVTQLFELSKMEAVEFKAQKEPFIIAEVLREIANTWQLLARDKNIRLECVGCEDVSMVFADVIMMERVIQNLLSNAIKFTPENGAITIKLVHENDELLLRFTNNGPAVPEEVINWISHYHKQRGIIKRPVKSGLGLAIVKRILELHDFPFTIKTAGKNELTIWMKNYKFI